MAIRWKAPVARLVLDGGLLVCLVLAFAYWWLGNGVHELLGTAFLLLVLRHIANNLFWWTSLGSAKMTAQRWFNLVLSIALALAVIALMITSVGISRSLAAILPMPRIFVLQEIHWFAAHWAVALAAMHLGVNWSRISALFSNVLGRPSVPGWVRIPVWAAIALLAVQGISSGTILGLWNRLAFQYSLSMWDFNQSVLPFFLHWAAAMGTLVIAAYAALSLVTIRTRGTRKPV